MLVPGAINLVQSPSYFDKLLDMGCPSKSLRLAGHWVSSDLCLNAVADSKARLSRLDKALPRRFLIAVGGAGAQRAFLEGLLTGGSAQCELNRSQELRSSCARSAARPCSGHEKLSEESWKGFWAI